MEGREGDKLRCILRKKQRDGLVMKLRLEETQEGSQAPTQHVVLEHLVYARCWTWQRWTRQQKFML